MLVRKVTALIASEAAPMRRVGSSNQRFKKTTMTATKAAVGKRRLALRAMKFVMENDWFWIISCCTALVIKKPEMTKNKSTPKNPDRRIEESRW